MADEPKIDIVVISQSPHSMDQKKKAQACHCERHTKKRRDHDPALLVLASARHIQWHRDKWP
jgi:hypothetical protein